VSETTVTREDYDVLAKTVEDMSAAVKEHAENKKKTDGEHKEELEKIQKALVEAQAKARYTDNITPELPVKVRAMKARLSNESPKVRRKAYDDLMKYRVPSHESGEMQEYIRDLQDKSDEALMVHQAALYSQKQFGTHEGMSSSDIWNSLNIVSELREIQAPLQKEMIGIGATAGQGTEWVPTGFSSQITLLTERELRVAALFDSFDMPQNPFDWPFATENIVGQRVGDVGTAPTTYPAMGSDYGALKPTGKVTFDAAKIKSQVLLASEFGEDAIRAALPWLRSQLPQAHARALEDGIINGDDGAAHIDEDVTEVSLDTGTAQVLWEGLRHYVLGTDMPANMSVNGAASAGLTMHLHVPAAMKKMTAKYGGNPADLALIFSHATWANTLKNDKLITMDKLGTQATILRGQLGQIFGIPIIVSEFVRTNLDTFGFWDSSSAHAHASTSALLCYRPGWKLGIRRRPSFEAVRVAQDDTQYMVSYMRADFEEMHNTAQKIVCHIRNLPGS